MVYDSRSGFGRLSSNLWLAGTAVFQKGGVFPRKLIHHWWFFYRGCL